MNEWLQSLVDLCAAREPCVLVTVASGRGSIPREPGAKMVVTAREVFGTIGGGQLEYRATGIAREMPGGGAAMLRRFALGASLGQCCGGIVNLLFEPVAAGAAWVDRVREFGHARKPQVIVTPERGNGKLVVTETGAYGTLDAGRDDSIVRARELLGRGETRLETRGGMALLFEDIVPPDLHVVLFGAGHVGRALIRVLGALPCSVTWVDQRDFGFPREIPPNVTPESGDSPEAEVPRAPAASCFLVMTHSHALDFALTRAILARRDYRYFGLIGSQTKRRRFEQRLRALGVGDRELARMTCPVGVRGIDGKEPATIAIAVAAQLLALRERAAAQEQAIAGSTHAD